MPSCFFKEFEAEEFVSKSSKEKSTSGLKYKFSYCSKVSVFTESLLVNFFTS